MSDNKEEIIKKLQDGTLQLFQKPITDKTSVCWNNFKVFISIYIYIYITRFKNLLQI